MKRGESGWTNCKEKGQERTLPGWPFLFFCVLIYIGVKYKSVDISHGAIRLGTEICRGKAKKNKKITFPLPQLKWV